jgi:acyl carrier protein
MTRAEITEKLRTIIMPYVQNKEALENVGEDTDLMKDLKINSQHLVDIILDAEVAFDIEIDDDSAEKMLTVGAAVDIVESLLSKK